MDLQLQEHVGREIILWSHLYHSEDVVGVISRQINPNQVIMLQAFDRGRAGTSSVATLLFVVAQLDKVGVTSSVQAHRD